MESVIFEIKEKGGLIFKSELGGGVLLFKGRRLLGSEKKVVNILLILAFKIIFVLFFLGRIWSKNKREGRGWLKLTGWGVANTATRSNTTNSFIAQP